LAVSGRKEIGAELKDGLREVPTLDAFRARRRDRLPHRTREEAPIRRRAVFNFLLDRTPKGPQPDEPDSLRKDDTTQSGPISMNPPDVIGVGMTNFAKPGTKGRDTLMAQ